MTVPVLVGAGLEGRLGVISRRGADEVGLSEEGGNGEGWGDSGGGGGGR